jgi:hypothetical protein
MSSEREHRMAVVKHDDGDEELGNEPQSVQNTGHRRQLWPRTATISAFISTLDGRSARRHED